MAGFNLPVNAIPPDLLAKMAAAAFRPPALMGGGGGGGGMGALPQAPGFNMGQDMAGMGKGLAGLGMALAGSGDVSSVTPTAGTTLGGGPAGGMTTVGPGGVYSVTGLEGMSFGGGMAGGGEVVPGKYYTVGEQGPETFVPTVPGRIYPDTNAQPRRERFYPEADTRDFFGGRARR